MSEPEEKLIEGMPESQYWRLHCPRHEEDRPTYDEDENESGLHDE